MRATMLLCDFAEEINGKLYTMGAGWTTLHRIEEPANMAVAVLLHFEWTETNKKHTIELELQTEDGALVEQGAGDDVRIIRLSTVIEVGRPPGVKPGSEINAALSSAINGLILTKGGYVWVLRAGETTLARAPFSVGTY
jgi:hypothetical protein